LGYNYFMGLESLPKPSLITRPEELEELVGTLMGEAILAVDTESNSLYAYHEQVCLIQFSTEEQDYLVDPLALEDLSPLEPIFSDPGIEKVFHAAEYDLICLKRDFGFSFVNLFDTMIAASILGLEQVGLGSLLEQEFNVKLDKRYQRANWGQRPLPDHLLNYARLDTHYLIALRNGLKKELEEQDRWALADEDFLRLCNAGDSILENNLTAAGKGTEDNCWKITGAHDLDPQQAAVLQELCRYRDHVARSTNRPLFKVISDATLLAIAANSPGSFHELKQLPGMSHGQIQRHGRAILQLVQRGLNAQPILPPRSRRPDEQYLSRLENLRQWRKETAKGMGVKSDVILSRDLLVELAEKNPHGREELSQILAEVPWRLVLFGEQILNVLNNHYVNKRELNNL
jgi:ribonuclease D